VDEFEDLPAELLAQMPTDIAAGGVLVQRDGGTTFGAIANDLRDQGVIFTDIHTALREHGDLLRDRFMHLVPARWQPGVPSNAGKFEALNAALFSGGSFLYVPPDTTVTLPLRAVFWATDPGAGFFPRNVVIVDRGSRVVFL